MQKGHCREGKKDAQSQLNRFCNFIVYNLYDVAIEARIFMLMIRNNDNNVFVIFVGASLLSHRQITQLIVTGLSSRRVRGWFYPGPDGKHAKEIALHGLRWMGKEHLASSLIIKRGFTRS